MTQASETSTTLRRAALLGAVAELADTAPAAASTPDARLMALLDEARAARVAFLAACDVTAPMLPSTPGYEAANDAMDAAGATYDDALRVVIGTPAQGLRGVVGKAAFVAQIVDFHGEHLTRAEDDLAGSIAVELVRVAGEFVA